MSDLLESLKRGSPTSSARRPESGREPSRPRPPAEAPPPKLSSSGKKRWSENLGCLLIGVVFCAFGATLMWFYFSGAPLKRGSPLAALGYGIMFALVGLLMLAGWFAAMRR